MIKGILYPVFGNLSVIYLLIKVFHRAVENLARAQERNNIISVFTLLRIKYILSSIV